MEQLFVYTDIRIDTGKVFYVGKGNENRIKLPLRMNRHWINIVRKNKGKFIRSIALRTFDKSVAPDFEKTLITRYGRKTLANFTDGGEGVNGFRFKHTQQTKDKIGNANRGRTRTTAMKEKMSAVSIGNKHNLGNKASLATKLKMSLKRKGRKKSILTRENMSKAQFIRWRTIGKNKPKQV